MKIVVALLFLFSGIAIASDYNYTLSRNYFYLLAAGAWNNPSDCATKAGFQLVPEPNQWTVNCSLNDSSAVTCSAYIAINPTTSTVLVGFRGTQCYNDSYCPEFDQEQHNFNLKPFDEGQIDEFFLNAFNNLYKSFSFVLQKYNTYQNLWLTGHSLGAAEATATAVRLTKSTDWFWTPDVITVYTYGCPRVGDDTFAKYINDNFDNYFRVVHGFDPIPHAPVAGYFAASVEVWYMCPMYPTSPYAICNSWGTFNEFGNLSDCSDTVQNIIFEDPLVLASYHLNYYELDITAFADNKCCGCETTWLQSDVSPCDCYKIFKTPTTWSEANMDCELQNVPTTLATVNNAFESSYMANLIKALYSTCSQTFIGLNHLSGAWTWAGDKSTYTNWKSGNPGNTNNLCAAITNDGTWVSIDCETPSCYICKINNQRVQD